MPSEEGFQPATVKGLTPKTLFADPHRSRYTAYWRTASGYAAAVGYATAVWYAAAVGYAASVAYVAVAAYAAIAVAVRNAPPNTSLIRYNIIKEL